MEAEVIHSALFADNEATAEWAEGTRGACGGPLLLSPGTHCFHSLIREGGESSSAAAQSQPTEATLTHSSQPRVNPSRVLKVIYGITVIISK